MSGTMLTVMLVLFAASIPVAIAIGLAAIVGIHGFTNFPLVVVAQQLFVSLDRFPLAAIPFFILAGNLMEVGGISRRLVEFARSIVGGIQGGLPATCVITCMIFAAISGSSVATTFAIGAIMIPALVRAGYPVPFAAALQATAAELGVIIPPSIPMILYGVTTQTSIPELFIAGFGPGILIGGSLIATVLIWCRVKGWGKEDGVGRLSFPVATRQAGFALLMPFVVLGGIYGGVFTATEGAGIGAFGAFCIALARKALTWRVTLDILIDSSRTTGMLFMILVGALIFGNFINFTSMPNDLKAFVMSYQISPISVMVAICVIYILLGTAMEELSMILLTIPVFFPLVVSLGFDPVWFGIIIVLVVMIGLISPPVGMNMFVVKSLLPHLDTSTIFRGVMPFVYTLLAVLALLVAFPPIILIVPQLLKM